MNMFRECSEQFYSPCTARFNEKSAAKQRWVMWLLQNDDVYGLMRQVEFCCSCPVISERKKRKYLRVHADSKGQNDERRKQRTDTRWL